MLSCLPLQITVLYITDDCEYKNYALHISYTDFVYLQYVTYYIYKHTNIGLLFVNYLFFFFNKKRQQTCTIHKALQILGKCTV